MTLTMPLPVMTTRPTDHLSLVNSTMAYTDETRLIERSHLHYLGFYMHGITDLDENDETRLGKLVKAIGDLGTAGAPTRSIGPPLMARINSR
jgi:hypothetical protein